MADTMIVLDLDPADQPHAPRRERLPWVLLGVLVPALIVALALTVAELRPQRPAEPVITTATDGIAAPVQVVRDGEGVAVVVIFQARLFDYQRQTYCELTVDGQTVRAESDAGWPATCVWVRGGQPA